MAWFRNYYRCVRCKQRWTDEWSAMCDDDCPYCGARHMSPYNSDDLTEIIDSEGDKFFVLRSPKSAEHRANYRTLASFKSRTEAEAFLAERSRR